MVPECSGPECSNAAARSGLCWGHLKQMKLKGRLVPLRAWGTPPHELLGAAASAYADASEGEGDDQSFEKLRKRLAVYARRFLERVSRNKVHKRTKTPPHGQGRAPRGR